MAAPSTCVSFPPNIKPTDATNWDDGTYIDEGHGFYSNNIVLHDEEGAFLLMQYSKNYELSRVNVWHKTLRIKKQ